MEADTDFNPFTNFSVGKVGINNDFIADNSIWDEDAISYIRGKLNLNSNYIEDELLEVTPKNIRMRKQHLTRAERKQLRRNQNKKSKRKKWK